MSSTHSRKCRPPVADLDAALPARLEADLERVDPGLLLVDDVVRDLLADVLDERRVQDRLVRRLRDRLAGVFVQLRLGVEALEMADTAAHHEPDHALGPGLSWARVGRRRSRPGAWPPGSSRRNPSPRRTERSGGKFRGQQESCEWHVAAHRIETKSLWFKSTWTSAARAFRWGSVPALRSDTKTPLEPLKRISAFGPLAVRRRSAQHALERRDARKPIGPRAYRFRRPRLSIVAAISAARCQRNLAIGQGQGLLGHDRFVAAVAFLDARGIEHDQKWNAIAACVAVIDRAAVDGLGGREREGRPRPSANRAGRRVAAGCRG